MAENPGKSLAQKLGFSPGDSVFVETTPDWYSDFADDSGLELEAGLPATHAHIFCEHEAELADFLEHSDLADIEKSVWISWPKKTSGHQTDLGEDTIRAAVLPLGWVDTKVAAVDDTWSGLKFLRRKAS
ncbi:MAG TPA: hypothetical protein VLE99_01080 [Candidatus Saccharimonadales bacterium]|nr:hypothetical protein [Candidatus Saccharimonadales bacterium]